MPETLTGQIERVTYHNAENGFAVLRVKVRGQRPEDGAPGVVVRRFDPFDPDERPERWLLREQLAAGARRLLARTLRPTFQLLMQRVT